METIRLGKTGMQVTRLGFGGIPIQRLTRDEAVAVVKKCLELGVAYIDTANAYTTSEENIGYAIAGQREKLILATKSEARTPELLEKHLQLSLQRLKTDYIDLFQLHNISDFKTLEAVLQPEGLISVLRKAQKSGIIKHIGITSHQIDVAQKAVQSDQFETIMFPLNFIASEAAESLLPLCRKHEVGFVGMKPMAGGMIENATAAIKYLLRFPDIVIIPGIQKIAEIEEIAQIFSGPRDLTPAEQAEMKRIKDALGSRFCHRCDYCQPCTTGIPISMVMSLKHFYKRLPSGMFFSEQIVSAIEKAAGCSDCGECEKRCPYHLPIRELLSEQVDWYRDLRSKYWQHGL